MPPSTTASGPHAGQPVLAWGKPLGQAPVVVIMIHGRGAGPENILELAPAIGEPNATYLAPGAANNTWYPYSFMTQIAKNEPFLSSALSVLGALVDGTPFFFGCSDIDAHIPEARVRESADVCTRMGADVTTRIYPGMGHLVNDDEITHAREILKTLRA